MHFAPGVLNGNSLQAEFLNDINMSSIITLNTPQNLTNNLIFSKIYLEGQITSKGPINEIDLQQEFNNTLLVSAIFKFLLLE